MDEEITIIDSNTRNERIKNFFINNKKKNLFGDEALNENNLVCKAIKYIKKKFKNEIGIMCDVALDPYI